MDEDGNTVNVNQIVQSLSFEVEAIPQDNVLQLTSTPNSTPLNVKIKVRKKPNTGNMQHAVISLPKYSLRRKKPKNKRVRLVSSDQTIMSFNMFMESDDQMVPSKAGKTFFRRLKSGGCLEPSATDDEYSYAPSTSSFASSKPKIYTIIPDETPENSEGAKFKKTGFKGKCKPGGCLDPPFGEDKYPYMPSKSTPLDLKKTSVLQTEMLRQENIYVRRSRSPSPPHDMSPKRSFYTTTEQKPSDLSIYKPELDNNELGIKYSHSIITYPPAVTPSELEIFNSTREKSITSVADKTRKSFGQSSETYFSPKKQSFEGTTSNQEGLLRHTFLDIQVSADNINSDTKVLLETNKKKVSISKQRTSISEKVHKTEGTTQDKLKEFLPTSAILRSGTNEIDETASNFENLVKENIPKESSQLNLSINKPTEVLINKNLSQDITKSDSHRTDLNISNLIKEMTKDRSEHLSEQNKRKSTLSNPIIGKSRNTSLTHNKESESKQLDSRNKSPSKSPKTSLESERKTSKSLSPKSRTTSMDSEKSVRTGIKSATSPRKLSEANKLTKTESVNDQIMKNPTIYPATAAIIQDSFQLSYGGSKSPVATSDSYNKTYDKSYMEIETKNIPALKTSNDDIKNKASTESLSNTEKEITQENIQDLSLLSVTDKTNVLGKMDSKTFIHNEDKANKNRYSIVKNDIEFDKARKNSFEVPDVISKARDINKDEIETTNLSVLQTKSILNETSQDENTGVECQETSGNIAKDKDRYSIVKNDIEFDKARKNCFEVPDVISKARDINEDEIETKNLSVLQTKSVLNETSQNENTGVECQETSGNIAKDIAVISPLLAGVIANNILTQDVTPTAKELDTNTSQYDVSIKSDSKIDFEKKYKIPTTNERIFSNDRMMLIDQQKTIMSPDAENISSYYKEDLQMTNADSKAITKISASIIQETTTKENNENSDQIANLQEDSHETEFKDVPVDFFSSENILEPQSMAQARNQSSFTEIYHSDAYDAKIKSDFIAPIIDRDVLGQTEVLEDARYYVHGTKSTISTSSRSETQGLWRNEGQINILSPETSELDTTSNAKKQSFDASFLSIVNESIIQSKISPIKIMKYDKEVNDKRQASQKHQLPFESRKDSNDSFEEIKDNNLSNTEYTFELLGDKASLQENAAKLAEATDFYNETDDGSYRHDKDTLQTNINDGENTVDRVHPNKYGKTSDVNVKRITDQKEQSEKNTITDKDSDRVSTSETLDDLTSKISGFQKGILKETSPAKNENNKYDSELSILLNKSSVQEEQSENVFIADKKSDKVAILNANTTKKDPKISEIRTALIKDISTAEYENSKYDNKSSILLNKSTKQTPMAGDVIKMDSENVTLDLALKSFLDKNNYRVIKSLDTASIPDKHSDKIITIRSSIKTDDPSVRIPIGSQHNLSIQFNKKSFNDFHRAEDLGSTGVTIMTEFGKPIEQKNMPQRSLPKSGSRIIDETLSSIYEHQLVPLQNVIQNLKEEIDDLAAQQEILRERLLGLRRRKSIRFNVRKCSCWMK